MSETNEYQTPASCQYYLNENERKIHGVTINILAPQAINLGRVYSLLVNAFECVSSYWIDDYEIGSLPDGYARSDIEFVHAEVPLLPGGALLILVEGESHTLDLAACEEGLRIMAKLYPHHWQDFVTEGDDATTADVFLQCAVLKDLVYG